MDERTRKQYLRARNRIAIAAFLIIGIGCTLGDSLIPGSTGPVRVFATLLIFGGFFGGILLFIIGNILVRRRYRSEAS